MKTWRPIILIATACSIVLPSSARAADPPASAEWPAPRRSAPAADAAVPEGPALPPEGAAPSPSGKRKACARGKKKCRKPSRPRVDPRLVEAEATRTQLLQVAGSMAAGGRHGDAAEFLATAAHTHRDPILYLAAADMQLAVPDLRGRQLDRVLVLTRDARQLAEHPEEPRVAPERLPELLAHGQELADYAEARRTQLRLHRRGRAEAITGGAFLVVGLGGIALLTSGAALDARVDAAGRQYTGTDAVYLDGLAAAGERADAMLAAGLVTGLVGLAIGVPLAAIGARDLKLARAGGRERPQLRITPGVAGASVRLRF